MPTLAYLTINGSQQGLISAGALSQESAGNAWQQGHEDQILAYIEDHDVVLDNDKPIPQLPNPLVFTKGIDKASPLLLQAMDRSETLDLFRLDFYRISAQGAQEHFHTIELKDAFISQLNFRFPSLLEPHGSEPHAVETFHIKYQELN